MQILNSFDSYLDKKLYREACAKYGSHKILLIKKHPVFLLGLTRRYFFSIVLLICMVWGFFANIGGDSAFIVTMIIATSILLIIQLIAVIFSSFFGKAWRNKNETSQRAHSFFDAILITVLITNIIIMGFLLRGIFIETNGPNDDGLSVIRNVGQILAFFIFVALQVNIIKTLIDYHLDFIIVNPDNIDYFNQENILLRKKQSINIKLIRSIQSKKGGFLNSLLDVGSITFFTEGANKLGTFTFSCVYKPEKIEHSLNNILLLNEEKDE